VKGRTKQFSWGLTWRDTSIFGRDWP